MGLLGRSLEGFRSVAEASKTDPLLRTANLLVLLLPVYNVAGSLCEVQYQRYLESRKKRLDRASRCGADLQLRVSKEEAEKDEFQISLLKAIAAGLEVPETRLTLQGLREARNEVFLRVVLTRPTETGKGESAVEGLKRLRLIDRTGPLEAIQAVVVDGDRAEGLKTYSVWLVPSGAKAEAFDKAVKDASSKQGSPSFTPHVTLLGPVEGSEEDVKAFVETFAKQTGPLAIQVTGFGIGPSFFRHAFLEVESSSELSAAHQLLCTMVPRSRLPAALGGKSCRRKDVETQKLGFRPHLSLAYSRDPPKVSAEECSSLLSASFVAKDVQIWECDLDDFTCKSWKNVATCKLEGKQPISFWRLLRRFSTVAAPEFAQITLGTALNVACTLVVDRACEHDNALCSGQHVGKSNAELVQVLCRGLALWGLVNQLEEWSSWLMSNAGIKIGCRLRGQLFERLVQQDVKWISQKGADELYKTLMQRTENVQRVFTREIPQAISMVTNLLTNIGLLWLRRPRLCAFGLGVFAFQNLGFGIFDSLLRVAQDHDAVTEEIKENALEVLQNFRIVRAFGREGREKESFLKSLHQQLLTKLSSYVSFFTDNGSWLIGETTFQVAYMYGGMLVNMNYIASHEVRDAVSKVFKSTWPLYRLKHTLQQKSTFPEDAAAVLEALERPPDIPFEDDSKHNPRPEEIKGDIKAVNMSFSYGDDVEAPVLKSLNFCIPAGSMVGLVGPSGCGKSTLFSLLLRFYDAQLGSIEIDGVSLADWNPQALYRAVAWVSQDQCVFQGSVLDNIRYGVPDASEEDVLRAMREADLYDDVMKKPQGVGTPASELSGGQKQRLSIARAVLTNPRILLLDEATSALDTVSERKVQKALESLMKGRTVIAIAHRLSTIMNANLIMVMEAGAIVEQGTHAELLQKVGGKYANLVQQQLAVDDDSAKAETSTDPQAVQDCALGLEQLRARVPAELRDEVDQAVKSLKNASATLRAEKQRLALRERSLLGQKRWKAATTLRNAMRAIKLMRPDSSPDATPPLLIRALSTASEVASEDPKVELVRHLSA